MAALEKRLEQAQGDADLELRILALERRIAEMNEYFARGYLPPAP
jgi:hypothetical protein